MRSGPELSGWADVVIVGGGPAGLAAACACRRSGLGRVVVLDREAEAGGVPRHCAHTGFGLRDLHRVRGGPAYAAALLEAAIEAGAEIRTRHTATDLDGLCVRVTSPGRRYTLHGRAVVLATGCRERPRAARWVAGDRPAGVLTTGQLQQLDRPAVALGRRAVVVGAEHVSYSAALTLREAGVRVVAMVTEAPDTESFAAFDLACRARYRFPLLTGGMVRAVRGRSRVEAVEVMDAIGVIRVLNCDTVVFTADWIPDHELARRAGVPIDPGTRGPAVDAALRTTTPGVFAAGNVLHGAETADVCALDGRAVAASIVRYLDGGAWPAASVPVQVASPLAWVAPNLVSGAGRPPRGLLLLRTNESRNHPRVRVRQGDRVLWSHHVRWTRRGRSLRLAADWLADVDLAGPPVIVALKSPPPS